MQRVAEAQKSHRNTIDKHRNALCFRTIHIIQPSPSCPMPSNTLDIAGAHQSDSFPIPLGSEHETNPRFSPSCPQSCYTGSGDATAVPPSEPFPALANLADIAISLGPRLESPPAEANDESSEPKREESGPSITTEDVDRVLGRRTKAGRPRTRPIKDPLAWGPKLPTPTSHLPLLRERKYGPCIWCKKRFIIPLSYMYQTHP
jgi:hypothetical protein